ASVPRMHEMTDHQCFRADLPPVGKMRDCIERRNTFRKRPRINNNEASVCQSGADVPGDVTGAFGLPVSIGGKDDRDPPRVGGCSTSDYRQRKHDRHHGEKREWRYAMTSLHDDLAWVRSRSRLQ